MPAIAGTAILAGEVPETASSRAAARAAISTESQAAEKPPAKNAPLAVPPDQFSTVW